MKNILHYFLKVSYQQQKNTILSVLWIVLLLLGPTEIQAQISVGSTTATTTVSQNVSLNHTVSNVNNRLLLVGISLYSGGGENGVSNVTYGGTNLNLVTSIAPSGSGNIRTYIYGMINPPVGTASVKVNMTGSSGSFRAIIGATNFSGVHQSNPYGTKANNSGNSGTTVSLALSNLNDTQVAYSIAGVLAGTTVTPGSNQNALLNANGINVTSNLSGNGSTKLVTGTSDNLSYTLGTSTSDWKTSGVAINAACPTLNATLSKIDISCIGANDGTITVSNPTGTTFGYQTSINGVNWFPVTGSTPNTFTNLIAGDYTVQLRLTNGTCAENIGTLTIIEPTALQVIPTVTNATCTNNGSITLQVLGGTPPYTFDWADLAGSNNSKDRSNLGDGNYSVTVKDARNCTIVQNYSISSPVLNAFVSQSNILCFGNNSGSITVSNPTGGTNMQTSIDGSNWFNVGTSTPYTFQNLTANNYNVLVRLNSGNCVTNVATISITQPASLSLNPVIQNVSCFDSGSIVLNVTGGVAPYTFDWLDVSGTSNAANRLGLNAGSYNVVVKDANNCSVNQVFEITSSGPCNDLTVCNSENNKTYFVDEDVDITNYQWTITRIAGTPSVNEPFIISGQGTSSIQINWNNTNPGTFTLCTLASNTCGTAEELCRTIQVRRLTAEVSANSLCEGENLELFVSGGVSYLWSGPNNFVSTSANPIIPNASSLNAGLYTVQVTGISGCTQTLTINVPLKLKPIINGILNNAICENANGSITINISGGSGNFSYLWSTGATTKDLVNIPAGNYTLTVIDNEGCSVVSTYSLNNISSVPLTINKNDVTCFQGANGSVTATIDDNITTPPYTFTWSNGTVIVSNNPSFTLNNLSAGTYSVTVTDQTGCISAGNINVTQPSPLQVNVFSQEVSCFNGTDGSITINAFGGTPPYNYLWNGPIVIGNTNQADNLIAGIYTLTIQDSNGCLVIENIIVNQPNTTLDLSTSVVDVTCFGANNGRIVLNVEGGTAPFTYQWNGPNGFQANTKDVNNLIPGSYDVYVSDSKGCNGTLTGIVISEPTNPISLTSSIQQITCNLANNGAITINVTGGTLPYTYSWSNGASSKDINNLQPGTYTVQVVDAKNCIFTESFVIVQPNPISLQSSSSQNITCNGGNDGFIQINPIGGNGNYQFEWYTLGGNIPIGSENNQNLNNLTSGIYFVKITDDNLCELTTFFVLNQATPIQINGTVTNLVCFGDSNGSISINVSGGSGNYTYEWSTINGSGLITNNQNQTNLTAGNYLVKVYDANNCIAEREFTISSPTDIVITVNTFNITCNSQENGSINLTINGGVGPYSYQWFKNNQLIVGANSQSLQNQTSGTYKVIVTDQNNCNKTLENLIITETAVLSAQIEISNPIVCFNGNNGVLTAQVTGGTAPFQYIWSNGFNTSTINNLSAGNYSVLVIDKFGCFTTASIQLTQPPHAFEIFANVKNNAICLGTPNGAINVVTQNGVPPFTFSWTGPVSIGNEQNPTNLPSGNYQVVVTDANGCSATLTTTINEIPGFTLSLVKNDITCIQSNPGSATIGNNGELFAAITGGSAPFTFLWSNGATTESVNNLSAGSYSVTVTDASGCSATANITLSNPNCNTPDAIDDTILVCNQLSISGDVSVNDIFGFPITQMEFLPLTFPSPDEGLLSWGQAQIVSGSEIITFNGNYTFTPNPNFVGTVTILYRIEDPNGLWDIATLTIHVSKLEAVFNTIVNEYCNGSNGSANVTINNGIPPYQYSWSHDPLNTTSSIANVVAGNYQVTITDAVGCIIQKNVSIQSECNDADLEVIKTASNNTPFVGSSFNFSIQAKNNGPENATGVVVTDVLPNGYILNNISVSQGTWNGSTWNIGNLSVNQSVNATINVTVLSTGQFNNTATITGIENDPNLSNNSSTAIVNPLAVVDAVDDTGVAVNGANGGVSLANVLVNDTLNGAPATLANVNLSFVSATNSGVSLNANGSVVVAPGTPAGTYSLEYQICEVLNPTNCDTATVTVTVEAAVIDAVDDTPAPVNGFVGGDLPSFLDNDTLNGAPVVPSEVVVSIVNNPANFPIDTNTGVITVPAGTPAGSYPVEYQICEVL
ncbi:MAG: Ig-like domain-containing protein, partial [Flavobacterium sp.]